MEKISPSRLAAFEILQKIEKEKSYSSALLPVYEERLSAKDAALCHTLTLGVLRRKLYLDRLISKLTKKNIDKFDREVLIAMRLGMFQLLFLDKIPDFSAINESVNLVHRAKKRSATGLVNAVLRRVAREIGLKIDYVDPIDRIVAETSHPRWLIENWAKQFSLEKAAMIAEANNRESAGSFRFTRKYENLTNDRRSNIDEIVKSSGVRQSEIIEGSFVCGASSSGLRELAENGLIYFQDEGSQLVAASCGLTKGESFLDVCAAPGSKTTYVSSRLELVNSTLLVAGDLHAHRVSHLRENCVNQESEFVSILRYDAGIALPFADESFNAVLLDAPCSGTGTIRSNPEIRYFLEEKDLVELPRKQLTFLKNASKVVKSGGRLIYSTCSLEMQENEEVIEKFLYGSDKFEKVDPKVPARFLTDDGFARTDPSLFKMDGFFIAELRRKV